jgi:hypothetical protein
VVIDFTSDRIDAIETRLGETVEWPPKPGASPGRK